MRLLEIDENFNVKPNKPWINMIPEFKVLFTRDKSNNGTGSGKTEEGRHIRAKREIAFIYFAVDFSSPIRDWEPDEREKEALKYSNLTIGDIDAKVIAAAKKYEELQVKASRSLRTYRSMMKGLDALDNHFETINFALKDVKGEQVHDPTKFSKNMTSMNEVYDELKKFEKRVEDELHNNDSGARGNTVLGDKEAGKSNINSTWSESEIANKSKKSQDNDEEEDSKVKAKVVNFTDLTKIIMQPTTITDEEIDNAVVIGD